MKTIFYSTLATSMLAFLVFVGLRTASFGEDAMIGLLMGTIPVCMVGLVIYLSNSNERWAWEIIVATICASLMIFIASGFGGVYFGLGFAFLATLLAVITVGYERPLVVAFTAGCSMAALAFGNVLVYDAYYRSADSWFFGLLVLATATVLSYAAMDAASRKVASLALAG